MNVLLSRIPLWAAVLPLAAYLCTIGWLHVRRRPVAVSGPLDAVLLAVGLSGLVAAGPLALLQPAVGISPWAEAILLLAFVLVVACCVLAARPRLVVYNVSLDQVRPIVAEVTSALDPTARWAGETVALPGRGLQVHLDGRGLARTVTLVAVGSRTSAEAWTEFARRMRRAVRGLRVRSSSWGPTFLGLGVAVAAIAGRFAPPRMGGVGRIAPGNRAVTCGKSPHCRGRLQNPGRLAELAETRFLSIFWHVFSRSAGCGLTPGPAMPVMARDSHSEANVRPLAYPLASRPLARQHEKE